MIIHCMLLYYDIIDQGITTVESDSSTTFPPRMGTSKSTEGATAGGKYEKMIFNFLL